MGYDNYIEQERMQGKYNDFRGLTESQQEEFEFELSEVNKELNKLYLAWENGTVSAEDYDAKSDYLGGVKKRLMYVLER